MLTFFQNLRLKTTVENIKTCLTVFIEVHYVGTNEIELQ